MKTARMLLLLLCCLSTAACAYSSKSGMREDFEMQMKNFNKMLRWQEMEQAGMLYVIPEMRETFMKGAESARKKGITITDYRILTSECLPEKESATAVALFEYYNLPSNRVKSVTYYQEWIYSDSGDKKGWKLKSRLPAFE